MTRGFAKMTEEQRKEISRKGGIAAQKSGRAHRFTKESAAIAGRKGGLATHVKKKEMTEGDDAT